MQEYTVDPTDATLRGKPLIIDYDKELSTASNNGSTWFGTSI